MNSIDANVVTQVQTAKKILRRKLLRIRVTNACLVTNILYPEKRLGGMHFFRSLVDAILRGDEVSVRHVIDLGNFSSDLSEADATGMTALHWTGSSQESEILVPLLLTYGAALNAGDHKGLTPLHLCCAQGRLFAVTCLLHKGANVNARSNDLELTPLHLAVMTHHADVARLLLAFGADITIKMTTGHDANHLGVFNLLNCS